MRTPSKRPGPMSHALFGALSVAAAVMLGVRWYQALKVPNLSPALGLASSATTAVLMTAALGVGWRNSILSARAERDELADQIAELREHLAEIEDQAWWGAPPRDKGEDTVRLGPNVVPLHQTQTWIKSS